VKSNSLLSKKATDDPGKDGTNGFAPDAFAMQLEYFSGDYIRSDVNIASINTQQPNYYNGNITGFSWRSNKPASVVSLMGSSVQIPTMYTYSYDKKYQLSSATWGTVSGNSFTPSAQFAEKNITYDPNGNIKGLQRTNAQGVLSDDFSSYQYQLSTNKQTSVGNVANPASYATFAYDDLGQLKSENKTGAAFGYNIKYNVTGKVTGVYADVALTQLKVAYGYDENGNRISRTDYTGTTPQISYTVFDAGGNPMAMYDGTGFLTELPFYGSERLGTFTRSDIGYQYELRDNVGSVRVVIGDTKTATGQANVFTYNDYYPYGSIARSGGTTYRYEYQGAYADKDPITGFNNFDLRMYDGRIGRWLSTVPNAQYYSPYVGMGNEPVIKVDPDGGYSKAGAWWRSIVNGGSGVYQSGVDYNGNAIYGYNIYNSNGTGGSYFGPNGGKGNIANQGGPVFKDASNDVDSRTLGHNIFWSNYTGSWNPKSNNGNWNYQVAPTNRADIGAMRHDLAYDSLGITGASGVFLDTRAIKADYTLVQYELWLNLNWFNGATSKERLEGGIIGLGIGIFALPKTIVYGVGQAAKSMPANEFPGL
jgi:RHS repeat-associated protein